jgi:hypothetical protein
LALVKAYPEALTVPDPVSGLYPAYQLAACCSIINSDSSPEITVNAVSTLTNVDSNAAFAEMNVVYRLLRTCPDVVTYYRCQCEYKYEFEVRTTCMVH